LLYVADKLSLTDRYEFWKKYAYLVGAAADTGFNFNMLLLFIAFSAAKTTVMPNWVCLLCFFSPVTFSDLHKVGKSS